MKTLFLILATFFLTDLLAQTPAGIFASIKKSDGTNMKGTSVTYRYENLFVVNNVSGGTDNTATVELEVPTSGYTATFRSMVNTAPVQVKTPVAKSLATTTVKSANTEMIGAPQKTMTVSALQTFPISRIEISVTATRNGGSTTPFITRQIILENALVESCTEDIAGGTTKIKFKATRIGWIYVNRDGGWKVSSLDKSGWDTVTGTAWTNFQPAQTIW